MVNEFLFWHALCKNTLVDAHSTSYVCRCFINLGMTQSHFTVPVVQPANIANVLLGLSGNTLSQVPIGCLNRPENLHLSVTGVFFCLFARHLSRRRCVGCPYSPQSLTDVSSRGLARLPPFCDTKSLGHRTA